MKERAEFLKQNILDRREAIKKAISDAEPRDTVIITGKGSEQFLVLPGNKRIAWDDVSVVKEELEKLNKNDKNLKMTKIVA